MIDAYVTKDGQSIKTAFDQNNLTYFWLDLQMPTQDEIRSIEEYCGVKIPPTYMQQGNIVNHFSHDGQICFMTLLTNERKNIVLVLKENIIITINNSNRKYWPLLKNNITTVSDVFAFALEACMQNITEALEAVEQNLLTLSAAMQRHIKKEIIRRTKQTTEQKTMIVQLNDARDTITNNHRSLVNLRLLINFSKKCILKIPEHIGQNIDALISHTDFLSNKTSYLHSTVFGYLGITQYNQQSSFNIFSSVFFLPALVTGFFGMNFIDMPFLKIENSLYLFIFLTAIGSYLIYQYIKQIQVA